MMKFKYKLPHFEHRYKPIMVYPDKITLGLAGFKAYCDSIPGSKAQIRFTTKKRTQVKENKKTSRTVKENRKE